MSNPKSLLDPLALLAPLALLDLKENLVTLVALAFLAAQAHKDPLALTALRDREAHLENAAPTVPLVSLVLLVPQVPRELLDLTAHLA